MKRGFIRALWGKHVDPNDDSFSKYHHRRGKIDFDIELQTKSPHQVPFRTYVFGENNYTHLKNHGFTDCVLVDKEPVLWDLDKEHFRHKLEAFRLGMEDFDELVFLDWDTFAIKPLPSDFWEVLQQKQPVQALLRTYVKRMVYWRNYDMRKVPCASFVYLRDQTIPDQFIKIWEEMGRPWSEEQPMLKYMEELIGGWQGMDAYWEHFEPTCFFLSEGYAYASEQLASKDPCFVHWNRNSVKRRLDSLQKQGHYNHLDPYWYPEDFLGPQ